MFCGGMYQFYVLTYVQVVKSVLYTRCESTLTTIHSKNVVVVEQYMFGSVCSGCLLLLVTSTTNGSTW